MGIKFKSEYSFEARLLETIRIKNKYPDRLPVICERTNNDTPRPSWCP